MRPLALLAGLAVPAGLVSLWILSPWREPRAGAARAANEVATTPLVPAPATLRGAARTRALLVGIDRYAAGSGASFAPLSGCVSDTRRVRAILEQRFGWEPATIRVLTDEQATHEAVVRAFDEHLIQGADAETEVLFWYSGHGSLVPDVSRAAAAELGGKDSTLVLHDSRAAGADGAYDFTDDELHSLLDALGQRTGRITVVTDSCHSGGMTRGTRPSHRVRAADDGKLPLDRARLARFWPAGVAFLDDGDARNLRPEHYVHVSACASSELARELDLDGEGLEGQGASSSGALTFFLTEALKRAQPGVTYRALAEDAAARLAARVPGQSPWFEGGLDRELFGARFQPAPEGFAARVAGAELRIEAGRIHGLAEGSELALHDLGGRPVGRARVRRVTTAAAFATWLEPAPAAPPEGALRAVEELRGRPEDALELYCADAGLRAQVAALEGLRLADRPGSEAYRLARGSDGRPEWIAPGELCLWRGPEVAAARGAPEASTLGPAEILREQRYRALLALSETPGGLRLEGAFRAPTPEESEKFARKVERTLVDARLGIWKSATGAAVGRLWRARGTPHPERELALVMLDVTNRATKAVHVAVLSVSEDRQRSLVWPPDGQRDKQLAPGETVSVPVNVTRPEQWIAARPMRDRYLLVATLQYADLRPFETQVQLRDTTELEMPAVLQLALPTHRGMKSARVDGGDWGVATVDLLVEGLH